MNSTDILEERAAELQTQHHRSIVEKAMTTCRSPSLANIEELGNANWDAHVVDKLGAIDRSTSSGNCQYTQR